MKIRPESCCDFYKTGHAIQYPNKTELVYSNMTPRSSKYAPSLKGIFDDKVVAYGFQGFILEDLINTWNEHFFAVPRSEVLSRYKRRMDTSLGKDVVGTEYIEALHRRGYLPLRIKALPEGSKVSIRVPLLTIQNTEDDFYWLTNLLETWMSAELWKRITTATTAYKYRLLIEKYAAETGAPRDFINWQGHDFSFRGMSGVHDAASSGSGHLLSFFGTDTIPAIDYLEDYYSGGDTFVGGSVPATEHSVMCMGTKDGEDETFLRLITKVYSSGVVSIVSDTWDFWRVITVLALKYKTQILNRTPNEIGLAKVVFRPDSGDPVKIICGDPDAPIDSPQHKGAVECLWEIFGGDTNSAGYRTLNQRVGLIYGDSITLYRAQEILQRLKDKGFSSANIVFGIGSYTYQFVTRDAYGLAVKATFGRVDGEDREIFKDPVTDDGTKKSARGLIKVIPTADGYQAIDRVSAAEEAQSALTEVFVNSKLTQRTTLTEIRQRLLAG